MAITKTAKDLIVETMATFYNVDPSTINEESLVYGNCINAFRRLQLNIAFFEANAKQRRERVVIRSVDIATFRVRDLARCFGD